MALKPNINIQLKKLGLSSNEVKLYLDLYKHGSQSISRIAQVSKINRGTAYGVLFELLKKGLVSKISKRGIINFSAVSANNLSLLINREYEALENVELKIERALPNLINLFSGKTSLPSIKYLHGLDGARTAFLRTLSVKSKVLRLYLSPRDNISRVDAKFMNKYIRERINLGISVQEIHPKKNIQFALPKDFKFKTTADKKELRDVRHLKSDYNITNTLYITDEEVISISTEKKGFSLIIKSLEFAKMQRELFNLLWDEYTSLS